jgi:DNA-binding ferritin-like protein
LQNIGGDSVSKKIRNAVAMANPEREFVIKAKMRQFECAKNALKRVNMITDDSTPATADDAVQKIEEIMEKIYWMLEE